MVSTRNHPRQFPPPDLSPGKSSTGSPTKRQTRENSEDLTVATTTSTTTSTRSRARSLSSWLHTSSPITLIWLFFSLPLVIWDTGFVLGRPHTMPGGWLSAPLYTPYELYVTVDLLYGWPAWESKDGFTGAQGALNVIETVMYLVYLYIVFAGGRPESGVVGVLKRKLVGREASIATLIGFAAAVMTVSKTVLYWLVIYFADFTPLKHNSWSTIIWVFAIPNGLWILFPSYMIYDFASNILSGLEKAAGLPQKKSQ